jgi:hypothetical protein
LPLSAASIAHKGNQIEVLPKHFINGLSEQGVVSHFQLLSDNFT